MKKEKIIVPGNVRYISDWEGFSLFEFPHIMNKKIPGCGFTEYCIRNSLFTILCSPRIILLENKSEQHPEVFYFRNEMDKALDIDKDLLTLYHNNSLNTDDISDERRKLVLENLENSLINYISGCITVGQPCKILVTYDSYRLLKEILIRLKYFDSFYTIVDEFQSIFTDSRFKSDTEMEFVNHLRNVNRLCFVSATPMIDKYLEMLDEFRDLPYYELDWETENPLRVLKPDLDVKVINSVTSKAVEIIKEYQTGNFEESVDIDIITGEIKVTKSIEAVLYVNSVKNIVSIIKKSGLKPDEVNILCANTSQNQNKLNKIAGRNKYLIGKVPLKDEPRKMFTLCTRTVYLGADFYSDNARSFILSDANIDTLAVDITLDLPQILGRQRLLENPWKNRAELYFKSLTKNNKITEEDFKKYLNNKLLNTEKLLSIYGKGDKSEKHILAKKYQSSAKTDNYKMDYVAVNTHGGKDLFPVRNELVIVSELRAFEIQQIDYKDRFSVFFRLEKEGLISSGISDFIKEFNTLPTFFDKMRAICESPFIVNETIRRAILEQVPISFKNFYNKLGPVILKSCSYNITNIRKRIETDFKNNENLDKVSDLIYNNFMIDEKYSLSYIKEKLGELYSISGYISSPKASDLENYFEIKKIQVTNKITKKRDHYYKLLKKKE